MGSFNEHGVLIYLSKDLYTGFIRLQADKGLGRSFAGLLPFTEGLYRLGYISKEVYEEHFEKYSTPLNNGKPKTKVAASELQKDPSLEKIDRQLKGICDQWDIHTDPVWRQKAFAFAGRYSDKLRSARDILALKKEGVQ